MASMGRDRLMELFTILHGRCRRLRSLRLQKMSGHEDCSAGRCQHMGSSGMKRKYGEKKGLGGQDKLEAVIAKTTARAVGGHGVDVRHVQGVMREGEKWRG